MTPKLSGTSMETTKSRSNQQETAMKLLAELDALILAGTLGDWHVKHYTRPESKPEMLAVLGDDKHVLQIFWNAGLKPIDHANAAQIVALHNAYPKLRAAVLALGELVECRDEEGGDWPGTPNRVEWVDRNDRAWQAARDAMEGMK
jgi:hypothetical protein